MNLEYLFIILDYFKILDKRNISFQIILPIVLSIFFYFQLSCLIDIDFIKNFKEQTLTLFGILVGFSITITTILVTNSGSNIEFIKNKETDFKISNKRISLYQYLLINFTYTTIVELFIIIILISIPFITGNGLKNSVYLNLFLTLIFCVTIHVLSVLLINLTNLYFVLFNNK